MIRRSQTLLNGLIISITFCVMLVFNINFGKQDSHYFGDALGYYMYLPCTFIYHNLDSPEILPEDDSTISPSAIRYIDQINDSKKLSPKGIAFMQYTYGIALMESPFFFVAHVYEKTIGGHPNGYTSTYSNAIWLGNFIYSILGLLTIYHILKRYFSSTISLLTICCILLGTNLFWFTVYQYGMSHVPVMLLYSLLMLLTIKLHETPKAKWFLLTGFIIGLITVIRPTDILCVFIPLLYNIYNLQTLKVKAKFILTNRLNIMVLILAAFIPIVPQLLYWKLVSGSYIFYSYGEQSFNWTNPRIIEGLFYFSNGWLPYSLVMIFSLTGLLLYKYYKQWVLCILLILPLYVYIIYSWYCYNYINGLGSRPMLHMYPLLAIPLAAFFTWVGQKKFVFKAACGTVMVFMLSVNYSFSMLKTKLMLNSETANFQYCRQVLFKNKLTYNDLIVNEIGILQPNELNLTKVATLGIQDFEHTSVDYTIEDFRDHHNHVCEMKDMEYMPDGITITYRASELKDAKWLKCSGNFYLISWPEYATRVLVTEIKRSDKIIDWYGCTIDNKIGLADSVCKHFDTSFDLKHFEHRLWGSVHYFVPMPESLQDGDKINVYLWTTGKENSLVDDIKIEAFK